MACKTEKKADENQALNDIYVSIYLLRVQVVVTSFNNKQASDNKKVALLPKEKPQTFYDKNHRRLLLMRKAQTDGQESQNQLHFTSFFILYTFLDI